MRRASRPADLSELVDRTRDMAAGAEVRPVGLLRDRKVRPEHRGTVGRVVRLTLLLILLVAIGAGAAFAAASFMTKVYGARSEVAFDLRRLGSDTAERFMATQPLIARSRNVLNPVAAALDIPITKLEENLEIETVGASDVVRLQYTDPNGSLALDVIRTLTFRYLAELSAYSRVDRTEHWILTPAFVLEAPVAPQPLRAAVLGALAGLLIGGGVILLSALARPTS